MYNCFEKIGALKSRGSEKVALSKSCSSTVLGVAN